MKGFIKTTFAALLTLTTLNAHSNEYTYIDYALGIVDPEYDASIGEYSSLSGSFKMRDDSFISFESSNYEDTNEYDYDITALGIGAYVDSGVVTDIYGLVQLVKADLGYRDETGFRITVGLRTSLSNNIELAAKMKHEDIYRRTSKTYALELRNYLTTHFSVGASYETANINDLEIDIFYGSLRLNF